MTVGSAKGFKSLTLMQWRQFDHLQIDFHPRLTVITGANASGKSTIMGLLGRHFNWSHTYSSAPVRSSTSEGAWYAVDPSSSSKFGTETADLGRTSIGTLVYGTGHTNEMKVPAGPEKSHSRYEVEYSIFRELPGIYLTSHRMAPENYALLSAIPTTFKDSEQILGQFTHELQSRWMNQYTSKSPRQALKESLLNAAVFGMSGGEYIDPDPEAKEVWLGFQEILRKTLPGSLGFRKMRIRLPEVILETDTGDFILDEASGGLSAIIEVCWQIFLKSRGTDSFTVVWDEPENHLHPSLQRELIPNLLDAFPNAQLVVATHSPFIVTAARQSRVYVLDHVDSRVCSKELDFQTKAASADQTLRKVLGLESTYPGWAEREFKAAVEGLSSRPLDEASVKQFRRDLEKMGLESEFPTKLAEVYAAKQAGGEA